VFATITVAAAVLIESSRKPSAWCSARHARVEAAKQLELPTIPGSSGTWILGALDNRRRSWTRGTRRMVCATIRSIQPQQR